MAATPLNRQPQQPNRDWARLTNPGVNTWFSQNTLFGQTHLAGETLVDILMIRDPITGLYCRLDNCAGGTGGCGQVDGGAPDSNYGACDPTDGGAP